MRGISVDTFRDVAMNSGRNQADHFMKLQSADGTERCDGNTPIKNFFLIVSYADSWAEGQGSGGETSFIGIETEATNGEKAFGNIAEGTFES